MPQSRCWAIDFGKTQGSLAKPEVDVGLRGVSLDTSVFGFGLRCAADCQLSFVNLGWLPLFSEGEVRKVQNWPDYVGVGCKALGIVHEVFVPTRRLYRDGRFA